MWTKSQSPSMLECRSAIQPLKCKSGFDLIVSGGLWHFLGWKHLWENYLYIPRLMGLEIYNFMRVLWGGLSAKFLNSYFESLMLFCFCHFYILCGGFSNKDFRDSQHLPEVNVFAIFCLFFFLINILLLLLF